MGTRSDAMKPTQQEEGKTDMLEEKERIVKPLDSVAPPITNVMKKTIILVYVILALIGVGTGFLLSRVVGGKSLSTTSAPKTINTATVVGSTDSTTFKDSAVGKLQKGGIDGEGTHQLIRDGGPSQTVYLISSVVDLDGYVGKNVKVWGQTQAAQKAAWLMDVGKVELLTE